MAVALSFCRMFFRSGDRRSYFSLGSHSSSSNQQKKVIASRIEDSSMSRYRYVPFTQIIVRSSQKYGFEIRKKKAPEPRFGSAILNLTIIIDQFYEYLYLVSGQCGHHLFNNTKINYRKKGGNVSLNFKHQINTKSKTTE
jgi:hypothetical protein